MGASWLPNAVQEGPGLDFGGFWERPGRVSEGPKAVFFMVFSYISLYNGFNSAVTTLLHFPTLFLLTFWCGGLCTAHGIRHLAIGSMIFGTFWPPFGPHVGSFLTN